MSDPAQTPPPAPPEETNVEIHKPKPVHSWRELLTEIGVIVIGVAIALAGEQAVEWLHWQGEVNNAREFIASEMALDMRNGIERVRAEHCIEQRLDAIGQILNTASQSGALPPVGDIKGPPSRPSYSNAWKSVMSSQVATHFPRQELVSLGRSYQQFEDLGEHNKEENVVWSELFTMVGPGRRLDPVAEQALRAALGQARYFNRIISLEGAQAVERVEAMKLPFNQQDLGIIAAAAKGPARCPTLEPKATLPYGQAPLGQVPGLMDAFQKGPPYR